MNAEKLVRHDLFCDCGLLIEMYWLPETANELKSKIIQKACSACQTKEFKEHHEQLSALSRAAVALLDEWDKIGPDTRQAMKMHDGWYVYGLTSLEAGFPNRKSKHAKTA